MISACVKVLEWCIAHCTQTSSVSRGMHCANKDQVNTGISCSSTIKVSKIKASDGTCMDMVTLCMFSVTILELLQAIQVKMMAARRELLKSNH
ncbi:hypothetical protein BC628DRAFT_164704 [Trametes gibbosa]|nr:hypothetical protein BC628DRAFT_164704 [Trametes gibbosa]